MTNSSAGRVMINAAWANAARVKAMGVVTNTLANNGDLPDSMRAAAALATEFWSRVLPKREMVCINASKTLSLPSSEVFRYELDIKTIVTTFARCRADRHIGLEGKLSKRCRELYSPKVSIFRII